VAQRTEREMLASGSKIMAAVMQDKEEKEFAERQSCFSLRTNFRNSSLDYRQNNLRWNAEVGRRQFVS
jgi:hypothetical protein